MPANLIKSSLLALALGASATASAADFSYNYIEGGYAEVDNGDGLFVDGSHDIAPHIALAGGVFLGSVDPSVDVTELEFGAVYHQPLKSNLGFNAGLKLLRVSVDLPSWAKGWGAKDSDTGLVANAGLRFRVQPKIDLEGNLKLVSNDMIDDGLGADLGARFYVDPRLSLSAGLAVDTEFDGIVLGARYDL